jgi:hypothetical protein
VIKVKNSAYEKQKQKTRDVYNFRKENNLCTRCGKVKPKEGRTKCDECTKKQRLSDKKVLDKYKEKGICIECKIKKASHGRTKCDICNPIKIKEKKTIKIDKRKVIDEYSNCRERAKGIYQLRKSEGICTRCGKNKVREEKTTCQECWDQQRITNRKRQLRLIEGRICIECGKSEAVENNQKCSDCLLKSLSRRYGISMERIKEKLREQNGRCFYSGRVLKIGTNLSVEHIKPVSIYPEQKYKDSNLVLVDLDINIAKHDLDKDDFMQIVKDVYEYNFVKQ